ncbi:MAG: DUF1792 domain-containing protein [Clostridia bacterium]|nr:DUF1792 domain-containing protein [Clostridia bacterium]
MKTKYIFKYARDKIDNIVFKCLFKNPDVMSDTDTIEYILKNKCSISRFGDGELRLMRGIDLEFQDYDKGLAKKLKNVKSTDKCLVCIPSIFNKEIFNITDIVDKEYNYWDKFKKNRGGLWNFYFKNQSALGDAFISRFYLRKRNKPLVKDYVEKLKLLWDKRNIVFVEGEQSRLGVGNDLFDNAQSIKRILCPPVNCYSKYEQIKNAIYKYAKQDDLIIMALGPTATALAYELSIDFQCLDLGHIDIEYEWYRLGVDEKVAIPSKYVNEVKDGQNPEQVLDKKYLNEIVQVIH